MADAATNALIAGARCYDCYGDTTLTEVQTYIMAYVAGVGMDPSQLAQDAKCLSCLNTETLLYAKLYFLRRIAVVSTDPIEILRESACDECLPTGLLTAIETSLAAQDPGAPSSNIATLVAASKCYRCLSPRTLLEVQVYLLSLLASVTPTPAVIPTLVTDYPRIPPGRIRSAIVRGQENVIRGGGLRPSGTCTDVPANQVPILENAVYVGGVLSSIDVRLPQVCCNPHRLLLYECYEPDGDEATLYQTEVIPSARRGQLNYVIPITITSAFNRPYLIARQVCSDGTTSADSNVIQVGDPAAAGVLAATWSALVVTNGGAAPSATTEDAVAQFYAEIAAYGIGSKIKLLNLFAPDSFIASMTPQYSAWGASLWNKVNTVAVGFGQVVVGAHGVGPDSSTGIWTGFNPAGTGGLSVNNFGVTLYTNHPDFLQGRSGGRSGANYLSIYPSFNGSWFFDWPDNGGATRVTATIPARFRGFVSYNRSAANLAEVWYANRNTGFLFGGDSVAGITATAPNATMYIGAFNDSGTFEAGACRGYAAAAYHLALNALEAEKFYHAIENFRREIGGGYVPLETSASEVVTEYQNNIYYGSGVALSAGTRTALETFWSALVTANIHDKMFVVVPYVPDNLTAAITPMRFIGTTRQLTNTGFVAGDLTVNGLVGDALTKYLSTVFFLPSRFFFDWRDIGLTLYISSGKNEASNDGAVYSGGAAAGYSVQNFANSMYSDTGVVATGRIGPIADVAATGYYSGNRVAADDHRLYKAKSTFAHAQIGSNLNVTVDARGTLTWPLVMHAFNTAGAVGGFTSKRHSFFAIHRGLSITESAAFYNAIQALRTALGGGFV